MKVRRVVTGVNSDGKATVVSDTAVPPITLQMIPGWEFHKLWGADEPVVLPSDGSLPSFPKYYPPPGGFRFGLFTVPPMTEVNTEEQDAEAALQELEEKLPGMAEHLEEEDPGMHTTDTVDFEYVISGEVWLELDDGEEVHLKAGDTLVQNGTRHAWRNKSNAPCVLFACLIGVARR